MVGAGGLALAGFLVSIPVIVIVALLGQAGMVMAAAIVGVLCLAAISVVFSALQGVYVAAVYRYATTEEVPTGFDPNMLRGAFRAKKK